jgi:hypothetical protein
MLHVVSVWENIPLLHLLVLLGIPFFYPEAPVSSVKPCPSWNEQSVHDRLAFAAAT